MAEPKHVMLPAPPWPPPPSALRSVRRGSSAVHRGFTVGIAAAAARCDIPQVDRAGRWAALRFGNEAVIVTG